MSFTHPYILGTFGLLSVFYTALLISSYKKSVCVVCKGKKILNGHKEYLDTIAQKGICLCCAGKGRVVDSTAVGKVHTLLSKNVFAISESKKKAETYQQALIKYKQELTREGNGPLSNQLREIIQKLGKQQGYLAAVIQFHTTCAKKLCTVLYRNYSLKLVEVANQYLDGLTENKVNHYINAEVSQGIMQGELVFISRVDEMMIEINQTHSIDATEAFQKEIEGLI